MGVEELNTALSRCESKAKAGQLVSGVGGGDEADHAGCSDQVNVSTVCVGVGMQRLGMTKLIWSLILL